ncbi:hypothetical protein FisN_1Lh515 [Fistulifera solaris]|uniref:Uncharacterized protein n=1 Tax=Fistulifera solaris TaxID=1519565 RepID=A0A1Z5K1V7_FISSO|nr:hypothetical protein FisN_1Lh515 [Fistulifera solaris]|eukprot:GAX20011.1 hypothetical protein FisN_1Lh515 [Fistulifera solaris]
MKFVTATGIAYFLSLSGSAEAFRPSLFVSRTPSTIRKGYLDDLSSPQQPQQPTYNSPNTREAGTDRYGPGDWKDYVDFNEFDGGDGQMGVAGDGNTGLEKEWEKTAEMAKSKVMSAKNAWGKATGYAQELIEKGYDTARAQQLENWKNQQEVQMERNQHKYFTDQFDKIAESADEDWRKLSSFGVERTQDFDLNEVFGPVIPGGINCGEIALSGRMNQFQVFEMKIKNPFMGFSDFRAAFTYDTNTAEWSVSPTEGSLNGRGDPTEFIVKFRPSSIGVSEGFLVIETEDDKWTWKLTGIGSM